MYLGCPQLAHVAPGVLPRGPAGRERYLSDLLAVLLPSARRKSDAAR